MGLAVLEQLMDNKNEGIGDNQKFGHYPSNIQMYSMPQNNAHSQFQPMGSVGQPMMSFSQGMNGYQAAPQMMAPLPSFSKMPSPPVAAAPAPPAPPAAAAGGKAGGARFKKAPDAPKRFKSAFIIFSAEKHKEIKERLTSQGRAEKTTDIAKLVSEAWREMSPEEKESWEEKARHDKARYEVEKSMYKGPWKVPANKRTPKDPTAPKRPMSAFLAFSNKRRAALKRQHPDATNADLSKMLSKTWKEAPLELKSKYMEEEAGLRAKYKVEMAKWRKKVADEKKTERKERETMAMQAAEARQNEASVSSVGPSDVMLSNQQNYMPTSQQDMSMSGSFSMYGNPYSMAGSSAFGNAQGSGVNQDLGGMGQGMVSGSSVSQQQYPSMMASNPFSTQQLLGSQQQQQQQLIQQLIGQQLLQGGQGQRNMGMQYQQGLQGQQSSGQTLGSLAENQMLMGYGSMQGMQGQNMGNGSPDPHAGIEQSQV